MSSTAWMALLRSAVLVALAASAALFVDYTSFTPAFCGPGSGCAVVRASGYGYLFGGAVPVPLIGILGFGVTFLLSLGRGALRDKLLVPVAAVGGATAVVLILLQGVVIQHFCAYCVATDAAAMAAAGFAMAWRRSRAATSSGKAQEQLAGADEEWLPTGAWAVLGVLALTAPLLWPKLRPQPKIPERIQALYVPGKINVVEFADFECPFCRMLHPQLKRIIKDYPGQVNFVRLNMPLERHPQALPAAKAYVCAKAQGKPEEMADALFESEQLSPASNRRLAVSLGLDAKAYDACLADEKTEETIRHEERLLRAAGFQGLPTTYVGDKTIIGVQPEPVFRDAFERASRGEGDKGIPQGLYLGLVGAAFAITLVTGRVIAQRRRARATGPASSDKAADKPPKTDT